MEGPVWKMAVIKVYIFTAFFFFFWPMLCAFCQLHLSEMNFDLITDSNLSKITQKLQILVKKYSAFTYMRREYVGKGLCSILFKIDDDFSFFLLQTQVLDAGELVEFDQPYVLLQNPNSTFSKLVDQTGKAEAAKLARIALEQYNAM